MRRPGEPTQVTAVLDTLQRMLDAGTQVDVARLARLAVDRVAAPGARDSAESAADVQAGHEAHADEASPDEALLGRALALYARACAAHPPDVGELADWVVDMTFGVPAHIISLHDFADALGDRGLARIRLIVEQRLAESTVESPDSVAEQLGQELTELTGEVGGLVAAWERRLPNTEVSLKIVRVLRAAGRHSEAVAHAARARGNDPSRIGGLLAAGRDDDAWSLTRNLLGHGGRSGRTASSSGRTASNDNGARSGDDVAGGNVAGGNDVRERDDRTQSSRGGDSKGDDSRGHGSRNRDSRGHGSRAPGRSGDVSAGGPAPAHPAGVVVDLYREHVESLIDGRDSRSPVANYTRAAVALRRLRTLHREAGTPEAFTDYLADLVERHRRKTRLLDEIRAARIALPKPAPQRRAPHR